MSKHETKKRRAVSKGIDDLWGYVRLNKHSLERERCTEAMQAIVDKAIRPHEAHRAEAEAELAQLKATMREVKKQHREDLAAMTRRLEVAHKELRELKEGGEQDGR